MESKLDIQFFILLTLSARVASAAESAPPPVPVTVVDISSSCTLGNGCCDVSGVGYLLWAKNGLGFMSNVAKIYCDKCPDHHPGCTLGNCAGVAAVPLHHMLYEAVSEATKGLAQGDDVNKLLNQVQVNILSAVPTEPGFSGDLVALLPTTLLSKAYFSSELYFQCAKHFFVQTPSEGMLTDIGNCLAKCDSMTDCIPYKLRVTLRADFKTAWGRTSVPLMARLMAHKALLLADFRQNLEHADRIHEMNLSDNGLWNDYGFDLKLCGRDKPKLFPKICQWLQKYPTEYNNPALVTKQFRLGSQEEDLAVVEVVNDEYVATQAAAAALNVAEEAEKEAKKNPSDTVAAEAAVKAAKETLKQRVCFLKFTQREPFGNYQKALQVANQVLNPPPSAQLEEDLNVLEDDLQLLGRRWHSGHRS